MNSSGTHRPCDGCQKVVPRMHMRTAGKKRLCSTCAKYGRRPSVPLDAGNVHVTVPRSVYAGEVRTMWINDDYELRIAPGVDYSGVSPERVERATVEAYALTWGTEVPAETVDGRPCWVRYNERSFDAQFFDDDRDDEDPPLFKLNHGEGPHHGSRRGGINRPLGNVVEVRRDDYGLWTRSVLWDEPGAGEVRDLMADGRLAAFSSHVVVEESEEVGTRDGLPVYEVTEGWLIECGPTHEPSDTRAVILAVAGYEIEDRSEDYVAEARGREIVAGWLDDPIAQAEARATVRGRERRDLAAARRAEGLARTAAFYSSIGAEDRAREALGDLLDVCGDPELAREVLAHAGIR